MAASGMGGTGGEAKPPTVSLSLRLMRKGVTPETGLKADHDLKPAVSSKGTLFVGQNPATPPTWTRFLSHFSPDAAGTLRTQSCSAVLFIEAGTKTSRRLFALCFGQGHHALEEDAIQRGFGLKVVLNSVSRTGLRTLDSATLDSTVMQRRVQASRDVDLGAFDLDANRDLLRLASGTPSSSDFAKALTGKDALTLRAQVAPADIEKHCAKALGLYTATHYKKDFSFIDHVEPVGEKVLTSTLDGIAFTELKKLVAGTASDLHLAIPDVLSPEGGLEIGYFGTGLQPGSKTPYPELAIEDYVSELQKGDFSQLADMGAIRSSHEVRVIIDGEGDRSRRRKLYTCFVFETTIGKRTYVLFDGQWFLVEAGFQKEVEASYQSILKSAFLVYTTAKNERALIAELESDPNLLSMDQTRIDPKGAPGAQLEPCDFISRTRQLIHLKDGHDGSAPLSHLWNQGLVSAEAFIDDATFRRGFRSEARKREAKFSKSGFLALLPDGRSRPVPADYTVVFGVMRHPYAATGLVGLPFFSKVAMRAVAQRIARMGFPVELHLIQKT